MLGIRKTNTNFEPARASLFARDSKQVTMNIHKFYLSLFISCLVMLVKSQPLPMRMAAEWEAQKAVFVNYSAGVQ